VFRLGHSWLALRLTLGLALEVVSAILADLW